MTKFQDRYRIESTRLADWNYAAPGWYFVTVCTKDKKCTLGRGGDGQIIFSEAGFIAEEEMKSIATHYANVVIDRYVVMPNHVYAIVVIEGNQIYSPVETRLAASPARAPGPSLSTIVGGYKAGVSRICHANGLPGFAWQARFHEHILRSNASVNAVRDYIDPTPRTGWWIPKTRVVPLPETRQAASLQSKDRLMLALSGVTVSMLSRSPTSPSSR
jgi:REP element-mobilizing transposase RayT